jgi:L-fucose isomerase-like protein
VFCTISRAYNSDFQEGNMLNYNVKIGLVPLRRDCTPRPGQFNWEIAEERGRRMVSYIKEHFSDENVTFVDLKGVIDVEVLWSTNDVPKVAEHFRQNGVDAIMLIAANFGNEEAAGLLAKQVGKPVLLWGPQDAVEPDGMRYTDSQCGLFGISRMLMRMNVPYTYVENCHVEDEALEKGVRKFAAVACAVKNFYGMRIGQLGLRPRPFSSVICNEGQLMEEFGIQFLPINLAVVQNKFNAILNFVVKINYNL